MSFHISFSFHVIFKPISAVRTFLAVSTTNTRQKFQHNWLSIAYSRHSRKDQKRLEGAHAKEHAMFSYDSAVIATPVFIYGSGFRIYNRPWVSNCGLERRSFGRTHRNTKTSLDHFWFPRRPRRDRMTAFWSERTKVTQREKTGRLRAGFCIFKRYELFLLESTITNAP